MEGGYTTDDILSQALDLYEGEIPRQQIVHADMSSDGSDDAVGHELSLTQRKYQPETEPISEDDPFEEMIHELKCENPEVTDSQITAIRSVVDVSDMLSVGGPCQVEARRFRKSPEKHSPLKDPAELRRFCQVTDIEMNEKKTPFVPKNTLKKNKWAYNLFSKWRREFVKDKDNRNGDKLSVFELLSLNERDLQDFSPEELNMILPVFVLALRKEDGSLYKGESVLSIMCGIQRYVNSCGHNINFFIDKVFESLKVTIDRTMQSLCSQGIGLERRQALVITHENEIILWNKGLLGTHSPQALVDTVFWIIGLNFGLRGGDEHRKLSFSNFAIKVDSDGSRYLQYTESVSKTYRGGLKHRNIEPHTARAYEDDRNPSKCPIRIFEDYKQRLPPNRKPDLFYFRPLLKPKSEIWFSISPIGHNNLEGTVKRLMKQGGIEGYFTNHSLRASTATRLFRSGVPEQVIKEQTGHRSIAIEAYQRTSDAQKRKVSRILQSEKSESKHMKRSDESECANGDQISVSEGSGDDRVSHFGTFYKCENVTINNIYKS